MVGGGTSIIEADFRGDRGRADTPQNAPSTGLMLGGGWSELTQGEADFGLQREAVGAGALPWGFLNWGTYASPVILGGPKTTG